MSDIDTAVVDSLKVIDLKWPIREADVESAIRLLPGSAVISNWMENRERDNVVLLAFAVNWMLPCRGMLHTRFHF